jgi:hypothetical protein
MKILLGDFNAKVGREHVFKPTISIESLHAISNDNGVRVVNFAASKNLTVKSTMFSHRNIHKITWTSPDGRTHIQIDHILIGNGIQVYLMSDHSGQHIVILPPGGGSGRLLTSGKSCSTRGLRLPSRLEKRTGVAAAGYLYSSGGCQPSLLSQKV